MILAGEVWIDDIRADKAGVAFQKMQKSRSPAARKNTPAAAASNWKARSRIFDRSSWPHLPRYRGVHRRLHRLLAAKRGGPRLRSRCKRRSTSLETAAKTIASSRIERNARELRREDIPEPVDLVVIDVSFISATKILLPAVAVAKPGARPADPRQTQFELRREDVGNRWHRRRSALHEKAVAQSPCSSRQTPDLKSSESAQPASGAEGNQEYFLHARKKTLE